MTRLTKKDIGLPIVVKFWDHSQGDDAEPIFTIAHGELLYYNRSFIRIRAWNTPRTETTDPEDTEWAIMRKVVIGLAVWRP